LTAGTTIQYMVLKFARSRNEAILGTMDSAGRIQVQVWDGAAWGGVVTLATVGAGDSAYRGFDIEYETFSDRAFVVFNDTTADPNFVIWDGIGWSVPGNIDIPTAGRTRWIELAPNPRNNEIAMIILDSTSNVYGRCWNGGTWNNVLEAPLGVWDPALASTAASKAIDVAYEQQTGRAMFMWGSSTARRQYYRIWNGATANLSGRLPLDIPSMGNNPNPGLANWIRLVSDPAPLSNNIMYSVQDNQLDLNTRFWNGAAWDAAAQHPEHDNSLENASRNSDIVFETSAANAGMAWLLWGNGSRVSRRQWNGAAWGATATTGDDTSMIQLLAHPRSGAVFSVMYESSTSATDDLWESHLTGGGAVWSAKFTVWGGPTLASPVREKVYLGAELYNPMILFDWQEKFP
jgi:hypothetical protein